MIWGIDPGLQGGIATLQDDGKFYKVVDMPTILTTINKKNKNLYDIPHLFKILAVIDSEKDLVFLEKTQPIYGVRVQASYGLGYCEGLLVGMLVAKKVRYEFFRPQAWQVLWYYKE